jgi:hypothetical protein
MRTLLARSARTASALFPLTFATLAACSSSSTSDGDVSLTAARGSFSTRLVAPMDSPFPGGAVGKIDYHGGPVMTAPVNLYYIWYGGWSSSDAGTQKILTDFASHIGGSSYLKTLATYVDSHGTPAASQATYAGSTIDAYSKGSNLNDAALQAIVAHAITTHALPSDANGVYFVLTSADVTYINPPVESFCQNMCGKHSATNVNGVQIKYAFVGDPLWCANTRVGNCYALTAAEAPNSNLDADTMVNNVAHELAEAITDPLPGSAYFQSQGEGAGVEVADACAYYYDPYYHLGGTGPKLANISLGGNNYMIQELYANLGSGYCTMEGPSVPSCWVGNLCPSGNVGVNCFAPIAGGDIVLRRNGVAVQTASLTTIAEAYSLSTTLQTMMSSATPGAASWDVCSTDGKGGLLCTSPQTLAVPDTTGCQTMVCPRGTHWCGDGCAKVCG